MKKILPVFFLFSICFSSLVKAQKYGAWRTDSFLIRANGSNLISFNLDRVGLLQQKDSLNWDYFPSYPTSEWEPKYHEGPQRAPAGITATEYYLKLNIFHPPTNLFPDCVFLDPSWRYFPFHGEKETVRWPYTRISSLSSLRFYIDTSYLKTTYDEKFDCDTMPKSVFANYFQPFYFRKTEVSNSEYREFTNWVLDSIARTRLGFFQANGFLDWKKKIDWEDTNITKKINIYLPTTQRFYTVKEVDALQLIYKFQNAPSEYRRDIVRIYPDTLSWVHDFSYSFNEPMTNMYNWHPAYNDYPVVGVSYWQCLAFLEWKSKQLTQQMNKKGKHYKIVCALPKELEWDYASTAQKINDTVSVAGENYFSWCDNSWMTDLKLTIDNSKNIYISEKGDSLFKDNNHFDNYDPDFWTPYRGMLLGDAKTFGDYIADGSFHTAPVSFDKTNYGISKRAVRKVEKTKGYLNNETNERYFAHFDKQSGIYYLDGNVSEWMREDLDSTWRPIFLKHLQLQNGPMFDQFLEVRNIENYYYKQLPSHGKLIRGGNWYDERYTNKYGKNTAGTNEKTFLEPEKDHSTVGFRYVIYVYPAE